MKHATHIKFLLASAALGSLLACQNVELQTAESLACAGTSCEPVVIADGPRVMRELEDSGWSLAGLLGAAPRAKLDELAGIDAYDVVTDTVRADVLDVTMDLYEKFYPNELASSVDSAVQAARTAKTIGPGLTHSYRQFDVAWLFSEYAKFDLIAVVNRIDLHKQFPDSCGRIRLVYRLAYDDVPYTTQTGIDRKISSRLPMTLNVDLPLSDDGQQCETWAKAWQSKATPSSYWLHQAMTQVSAAASEAGLPPLASIETNFQALRTPGGIRADGGTADYVLRRYEPGPSGWHAVGLANTPDVAAIQASPQLRSKLISWIKQNLHAIDRGDAALLDSELIAGDAIAASPRGMARWFNRPFFRILEDESDSTWNDSALPTHKTIGTPKELLRRLDQLSCQGCHESRSIVGFHMIGSDERGSSMESNELALGRSPHLVEALEWRAEYIKYLAGQRSTEPDDGHQPIPARSGDYGRHCQLDGDSSFADWDCPEDHECVDLYGDEVGTCLPKLRGPGDPCELGFVHNEKSRRYDNWEYLKRDPASLGRSLACEPTSTGYAGGMLDKSGTVEGDARCGQSDPMEGAILGIEDSRDTPSYKAPSEDLPHEGQAICTPVPAGDKGFPECVQQTGDLIGCATPDSLRAYWVRLCDVSHPCRDDYVCTRVPGAPEDRPADQGACLPPYFVNQVRIDGHPSPAGSPMM